MGLLEKDPEKRWTVTEARKALRDLTNGALTNRAATQPTDPQAIMPTSGRAHAALHETPATYALPATADQTDPSRLGGRAMLAPDETVNDRVTAAPDMAPPVPPSPKVDPATLDATADAMSYTPGAGRWVARGSARPDDSIPADRTDRRDVLGAVRGLAGRPWAVVRGWPRAVRYGGVAAGIVLIAVLIIVSTTGGGGSRKTTSPPPTTTPTHAPSFPVQSFDNGRGIVVNVPQSWKESKPKSGSYVDFLDGNTTRKIRINVEASGNDPKQFLGVAEHGLERGSTCKDYQRVALTDTTLDGHTAAQLEYTCGSEGSGRHGIWAATTIGGKAYEFFLTVPDADFTASKPIYDEMVSSVKLTP
jgi:hypothetical protein